MDKSHQEQTHLTSRENLYRLSLIRCVVLLGQFLALIYFSWFKPIGLPITSIAVVLAIYTSVTVAILRRSIHRVPITDREFFFHLLTDIVFFSMLLYLSGGATNPFISYYLIPISICAIALPVYFTATITFTAMTAYSLLLFYHVPLVALTPHHGTAMGIDNLHIMGMWANFALSAAIITYFITQMANTLKQQQQQIIDQREAQLQDEQLLAVGTLAAGTAHELGTPLNTMKLTIDEMLSDPQTDHYSDLHVLNEQIDQCRNTLKQLQSTAEQSASKDFPTQSLRSYFDFLLERWQLMRPNLKATISYQESTESMPNLKFHPTVAQSILNLLNNAADASPEDVAVEISWTQNKLLVQIRDKGNGIDPKTIDNFAKPFSSDKADGLGLGLFLSHTTITRFGGTVSLQEVTEGGTLTCITLPFDLSKNIGSDK